MSFIVKAVVTSDTSPENKKEPWRQSLGERHVIHISPSESAISSEISYAFKNFYLARHNSVDTQFAINSPPSGNLRLLEISTKSRTLLSNAQIVSYDHQQRLTTLKDRFEQLASRWEQETCGYSSITKKITNLNYLKIIALGEIAVPLILEALQKQHDHWFVALKALTDNDPTPPGASFEQAVEAWLDWGRKQGLIN